MNRLYLLTVLLVLSIPAIADDTQHGYEQNLLQAIQNIQLSNHDQALDDARELISRFPTSKVGQLIYADLLLAKAGKLSSIGSGIRSTPELSDLTFEIRQRLSSTRTPAYDGFLPDNIITLAEDQPYVLVLDQSRSRLYVFRNAQGTPVLESDYFLSIGLKGSGKQKRGDQKTPIGIYHVTRYIEDEELPDLYGKGAFPVNYPNIWDKRLKRSGGGIWLHGTPSYTYNRAPWSSNGCMVLSNPDFVELEQYVNTNLHTPVIIVQEINWIDIDQWHTNRQNMLQVLSQWVKDWESNQHEEYMHHYSRSDFEANGRDYREWAGHKRWVNRNKENVKIEFSNLNVFNYPGEQDLVLMQFDQVYRSNILNVNGAKEMYWKKHQDDWKIVYEGIRKFRDSEDNLAKN
jgi:murein L,D-transpeptidase YafK